MSRALDNLYSLDVEADGPCAGLYSMLSFGLVPLAAPERGFYTTLAPISDRYVPESLAVTGWTREDTLAFPPAQQAMAAMAAWLENEPGEGRKIIWADNPAFDWQFFNYYCHAYLGDNPFGRSARRIGDYAAGQAHDPRATQAWKKMRTEAHTHNALDDARGNAGALVALLARPAPPRLDAAQPRVYALASTEAPGTEQTLEAVLQQDGSVLWAVRQPFGECLNIHGQWEPEPRPSERTDAFFRRCRWATAEAAYKAWEKSRTPKSRRAQKNAGPPPA